MVYLEIMYFLYNYLTSAVNIQFTFFFNQLSDIFSYLKVISGSW